MKDCWSELAGCPRCCTRAIRHLWLLILEILNKKTGKKQTATKSNRHTTTVQREGRTAEAQTQMGEKRSNLSSKISVAFSQVTDLHHTSLFRNISGFWCFEQTQKVPGFQPCFMLSFCILSLSSWRWLQSYRRTDFLPWISTKHFMIRLLELGRFSSLPTLLTGTFKYYCMKMPQFILQQKFPHSCELNSKQSTLPVHSQNQGKLFLIQRELESQELRAERKNPRLGGEC